MQLIAHAGLGWALAEAGKGDSRFRQVVFLSAILPDLDGLSLIFGLQAYATYHHFFTHSIPFAILFPLVGAAICRGQRMKTFAFALIGCASHLVSDYFLTGWSMALWYPFSATMISPEHSLTLDHPVNYLLAALAIIYMIYSSIRRKRTPFEVISAKLDQRLCNQFLGKKTLACHQCGRSTNERCSRCGLPICARHAPLNIKFIPLCKQCGHDRRQEASGKMGNTGSTGS
jgi:membrane-bound metal-dependent hydrolase YbcI (DUF457 family)